MADDFQHDVFLSFASDDEQLVWPVWHALWQSGLRVFWSREAQLRDPGSRWGEKLHAALERSRHLLVVVTLNSLGSSWVREEWDTFYTRFNVSDPARRIVPLLTKDFDPSLLPPVLSRFQACRLDQEESFGGMIRALGGAGKEEQVRRLGAEVARLAARLKSERQRQANQFKGVRDKDVLKRLREINELHTRHAGETRFSTADDLVMEFLVNHYMASYAVALRRSLRQVLPLPSAPRMEAAMRAISGAKNDVRAVSILQNDLWHLVDDDPLNPSVEDSPYVRANLEAAERDIAMQRVFVVENERRLEKIGELVERKKAAGIKVKYAFHRPLARLMELYLASEPVNILICDSKVLTVSTHDSTHEGFIALHPDEIVKYQKQFNFIWENSKEL